MKKYFDHVHTIQEQPVTIHKKLDKVLVENLNEVLAMYNRGIKLTFTDIKAIRNINGRRTWKIERTPLHYANVSNGVLLYEQCL